MILSEDVAERVKAELGWIEGQDFRKAGPEPIKRDYIFVGTRVSA